MEISPSYDSVETFSKIHGDECRICLKRAAEICELFTNGDAIPRKLMAVASVQVEEGDGLPPVICLPCNQLLDASYDFKLQIQGSDKKLRQILKLKSSPSDGLASANVVKAIIADVISSVISSETETPSFYSNADKTLHQSIESELLISSRIEKNINLLEDSQKDYTIESIKQEDVSVVDENELQKEDGVQEPFKLELKSDVQDDEEKPLIWRTSRLRCANCIKSFRTKVALQRHSIVHKRKTKLRYVCYVCDKQYSSISKLKNHVSVCHGQNDAKESDKSKKMNCVREKRINRSTQKALRTESSTNEERRGLKFVCKVCDKQFTYQKSFVSHARTHPEYKSEFLEDSYRCSDKEQENEEEEEEQEEEDEEEDDLPAESLQCTQCGKLFATKRNLKRHVSTHSGLKYNCGTCGKGFSRVDKLKDHEQSKHKMEMFESSDGEEKEDMDNVHTGEFGEGRKKDRHNRPHKCAMCPKSFAQAQSLANHMERHKRVKETQKRFLCEVCSKCFAQSGSLVAHMRTHTGVKPYVCNVCSRAFTKSTYLQLHLRTHSGEKPYICQYCSRAFARANTLARHITMHTGEAKYHCQICTKSFRRLTSLNEHTYTHTGQRPYACKICTKRYNNAGSLYAHRKKCKAQQLSGSGFAMSVENSVQQQDGVPQVVIYSQRKLVEDATVGQVTPTPQYMLANVHNQKSLGGNVIQPFGVDEQNVYAINSKQFKNPYYTIYPNM